MIHNKYETFHNTRLNGKPGFEVELHLKKKLFKFSG